MPQLAREAHRRWGERVVVGEFQLGREEAALEWRALWAHYERLPHEEVVLADGACRDAIRRVVCQVLVFLEEALAGYGCVCHFLVLLLAGVRQVGCGYAAASDPD